MADESILEKAKKIFAYTQSDNVNEAAVATARFTEFLLKHNLEAEEVFQHTSREKEEPVTEATSRTNKYNISNWKMSLAYAIAKANLCDLFYSGPTLHWVGKKSNMEVSQYLWEACVNDIERIADLYWRTILAARNDPQYRSRLKPDMLYVHGKSWKNSFYMGAVNEIEKKLRAQVNNLRQDENMNAMIVYNDRAVETYMKQKHPNLRTSNYSFQTNSGYGTGQQFGRNYEFKSGVSAGGSSSAKMLKG